MAHPSVLNKTAAIELDGAVSLLQQLLPEDDYPEDHENFFRAQRDAVGRSDKNYQMAVLVGALCRVVKDQDQAIVTLKRTKANAATLKEIKK